MILGRVVGGRWLGAWVVGGWLAGWLACGWFWVLRWVVTVVVMLVLVVRILVPPCANDKCHSKAPFPGAIPGISTTRGIGPEIISGIISRTLPGVGVALRGQTVRSGCLEHPVFEASWSIFCPKWPHANILMHVLHFLLRKLGQV